MAVEAPADRRPSPARRAIAAGLAAALAAGALLSVSVFHLSLISSGVVVAIIPWNHVLVACSLHGCYAVFPL